MNTTVSGNILTFALLGGILPALLWLWFWLREDRKNPEPTGLVAGTFIAGMIAVLITFQLEKYTGTFIPKGNFLTIVWAGIEEIMKFGAAFLVALRTKDNDEPLDPIVYMVTAALGFAALENTLFILDPLTKNHIMEGIITGNLRFIGASLLHVVSSSAIGVALGISFYKNKITKISALIIGLVSAITLHVCFNFYIINEGSGNILKIFSLVWIGVLLLLFIIEKIKTIKN